MLEARAARGAVPTLVLVWAVLLATNEAIAGLIAAVLVGPVFVDHDVPAGLARCNAWCCRATPVGVHPGRSWLGVRKWCADKLLEMSLTYTNSLYATLYTVPWLRALGARVGEGSEVSTVAHLDPDLLSLGEESFVADMATVGGATFVTAGCRFAAPRSAVRAFVGNAALLTPGTTMGSDSLLGVATVPPRAASEPGRRGWARRP